MGLPQVGPTDRRCARPAPGPAPGRRRSNVGLPFAGRRLMPSCAPRARLGTFRTGDTGGPLPAAALRRRAPGPAGVARPNVGRLARRTVQPAWGGGYKKRGGAGGRGLEPKSLCTKKGPNQYFLLHPYLCTHDPISCRAGLYGLRCWYPTVEQVAFIEPIETVTPHGLCDKRFGVRVTFSHNQIWVGGGERGYPPLLLWLSDVLIHPCSHRSGPISGATRLGWSGGGCFPVRGGIREEDSAQLLKEGPRDGSNGTHCWGPPSPSPSPPLSLSAALHAFAGVCNDSGGTRCDNKSRAGHPHTLYLC